MADAPLRRLLSLARRDAAAVDDAVLLDRFAAARDEAAFELLVWRHGAMVFGVCRRILGDRHAAEDAFQATFLALARQARSVRAPTLAGWLHRVARRVAVRAKARSAKIAAVERRAAVADAVVDRRPDGDALAVIDAEIDRLPARLRQAVVLCYLDGLTTAEAAVRLGCPRGTVLSRLAAARSRLRGRLTRRGVGPASLPAALVPPTVRAALGFAEGRSVGEAALLAEGVIHAMTWNKLKLVAVGLLTAGVLGLGWGVAPSRTGGDALPAARADDPPKPDRKADDEKRVRDELKVAMDEYRAAEEAWSAKRIDLKLRILAAEEQLKRAERSQASARDGHTARAHALGMELARIQQVTAPKANDERVAKLVEAQQQAEATFRGEEERRDKELLKLRIEVMRAEEALQLFERITAISRRDLLATIERLQDRLRPSRDGAAAPRDLERKLDDLIRELSDLRRELKK